MIDGAQEPLATQATNADHHHHPACGCWCCIDDFIGIGRTAARVRLMQNAYEFTTDQ